MAPTAEDLKRNMEREEKMVDRVLFSLEGIALEEIDRLFLENVAEDRKRGVVRDGVLVLNDIVNPRSHIKQTLQDLPKLELSLEGENGDVEFLGHFFALSEVKEETHPKRECLYMALVVQHEFVDPFFSYVYKDLVEKVNLGNSSLSDVSDAQHWNASEKFQLYISNQIEEMDSPPLLVTLDISDSLFAEFYMRAKSEQNRRESVHEKKKSVRR